MRNKNKDVRTANATNVFACHCTVQPAANRWPVQLTAPHSAVFLLITASASLLICHFTASVKSADV